MRLAAGKNITVLVVDDEAPIRSLMRAILQHDGYEVLEAEDGIAAYELLRQHSGRIGLLITDVQMPRMDGIALGRKVQADYPDIKVLYISGFVSDMLQQIPIERFLRKPFASGDFVQSVQRLCA